MKHMKARKPCALVGVCHWALSGVVAEDSLVLATRVALHWQRAVLGRNGDSQAVVQEIDHS